jgi:hypothetical protein
MREWKRPRKWISLIFLMMNKFIIFPKGGEIKESKIFYKEKIGFLKIATF